MTEIHEAHYTENVQEHLQQVQYLLQKHALIEALAHKQELPRQERHELLETLLHKRHLAELREKLADLHPADIAYILEALPIAQRCNGVTCFAQHKIHDGCVGNTMKKQHSNNVGIN